MKKASHRLLFLLLCFLCSSCSWMINLVVANHSDSRIWVQYHPTPDLTEGAQLYATPKTYSFDRALLHLNGRTDKRPKELPGVLEKAENSSGLRIALEPGQAAHIGQYASFHSRKELLDKNDLKIEIGADSILTAAQADTHFRYWENRHTDLLELR